MIQHAISERGAVPRPDGSTRFSVWAPKHRALRLRVHGEPGGAPRDLPMARRGDGSFEATVPGVGAGTLYEYVLDSGAARPDPASRSQPHGVHGPSQVVDPAGFAWSDDGWRGLEMADLVIYELHVGTFAPEGTFDAVIPRLAALRDLGITAIEIMPVAEFPGSRNWGYDGVHLYAPQSSYGGPEGLRRLVAAAHAAGLAVLLDVVYNHLGPEGNYIAEFGPYFTERYRTPWGHAINYDDAGSDEVRRFVLGNAAQWISDYHIDGLRLDAVHAVHDFGPKHILQEIAEVVHGLGERLGRRTLVIAESDLNDPKLIRDPAHGGYGLDAQWSDDFHHAVHVALTGERSGYYTDYEGIGTVAKAMSDRFVYDGRWSPHRGRRHGAPCRDVPADRFVICLQNHDQVGNRATGDRLGALVRPEQAKLAAALLLLTPYVPLLFMGEEYGEASPFQYFVSHGDEMLVRAVREGRRQEFSSFSWKGEVPDPVAEETFLRSRLDPSLAARPPHAAQLALYRALLRLRREEPALRPGAAEVQVECDEREEWIRMLLVPKAGGRPLLALFNLSDAERRIPPVERDGGAWRPLLATDDPAFGDEPGAPREAERGGGAMWVLPPHAARAYGFGTWETRDPQ